MTVFGYGEDALSFWALTRRTSEFLGRFNDGTAPADAVLYFRPSFGRLGSNPVAPGGTADSSQFGEFDALLGTPCGVYQIEAKWSRSSEIDRDKILLRTEQVRRHHLLRAYLAAWRAQNPANWTAFHEGQKGFLEVDAIRYPLAPLGSQLARNLETVLLGLSNCGESVVDVVLYVRITDGPMVNAVRPEGFQLVTIECPSEAGFVEL
jgi:hypothetical protein